MVITESFAKSSWIYSLASVSIVIAALYLAKGVLLPLSMAVLFTFLLAPICNWLERRGVGRIAAVVLSVTLTFAALGVIAWIAISQLSDLAPKVSQYQGNIDAKFKSVNDFVKNTLKKVTRTTDKIGEGLKQAEHAGGATQSEDQPYSVRVVETPPSAVETVRDMFGTVLEGLASTGIVIILVLFFLFRREDLRDRFIRLVGEGQITGTTQVLQDAAKRVSRYLFTQFAINVCFGTAVAIGLYFIKVPNPVLWGILTAVLKFVPYLGVWIAALFPVGLALAISDGWAAPMMAAGLFMALEFIVGNFIEPWLFGKHTGVSPVAILMAAVFWAWLWGGVGLLLATPLTVCLLVIGKHVPQLAFLYILLGDEPVFDMKTRVYQRLLAGDQENAADLIEQARKEQSLIEVYDNILVPVLYEADKARLHDEVEPERLDFIFQSISDIVDDLGETEREQLAAKAEAEVETDAPDGAHAARLAITPMTEPPRVLCVSTDNKTDGIVTAMLGQLIEFVGCEVRMISLSKAGIQTELTELSDADLIYISAMPPGAVTHARQLYRRVQRRFTRAKLIVGFWNMQADLERAKSRVSQNSNLVVATTLKDAMEPLLKRLGIDEPAADVSEMAKEEAVSMV